MYEERKNYQAIPQEYWTNGIAKNNGKEQKEKFSVSNLVNLLTTQIVQDIPGAIHLSDNKFIAFQEHLTQIVQKEIAKIGKVERIKN